MLCPLTAGAGAGAGKCSDDHDRCWHRNRQRRDDAVDRCRWHIWQQRRRVHEDRRWRHHRQQRQMELATGDSQTAGASGNISISTGSAVGGNGGDITMKVGDGDTGSGGAMSLTAGKTTAASAVGGACSNAGAGASAGGAGRSRQVLASRTRYLAMTLSSLQVAQNSGDVSMKMGAGGTTANSKWNHDNRDRISDRW